MSTDFSVKDVLSLCVDYSSPSSSNSMVDEFVSAVERNEGATMNDARKSESRSSLT